MDVDEGASEDHKVIAQLLTSAVPSWRSSEPHAVTHTHTHTHRTLYTRPICSDVFLLTYNIKMIKSRHLVQSTDTHTHTHDDVDTSSTAPN